MRTWVFIADMNYDGGVTISDLWLWFKWLYFYPGDALLLLTMEILPSVSAFFEISQADFGGVFSGVISFFVWAGLTFAFIDFWF
jgi:hypothetical protein